MQRYTPDPGLDCLHVTQVDTILEAPQKIANRLAPSDRNIKKDATPSFIMSIPHDRIYHTTLRYKVSRIDHDEPNCRFPFLGPCHRDEH
jgi:hypothetical protein